MPVEAVGGQMAEEVVALHHVLAHLHLVGMLQQFSDNAGDVVLQLQVICLQSQVCKFLLDGVLLGCQRGHTSSAVATPCHSTRQHQGERCSGLLAGALSIRCRGAQDGQDILRSFPVLAKGVSCCVVLLVLN